MRIELGLTDEELDFMYSSGYSGVSDALNYHAQNGDLRILPIMDKIADALIYKSDLHVAYGHLINYYKNKGDFELVKDIEAKDKYYAKKYNMKYQY